MEASILIVSKNRKAELQRTIVVLESYINKNQHEILVFLDGTTDGSEKLEKDFSWISWYGSEKSLGASKARNFLYRKAKGEILFGFDDDSYPIDNNFIKRTTNLFRNRSEIGIIAFEEIKGLEMTSENSNKSYLPKEEWVNQFLGCGFAIRKDVYFKTRGFPTWIDIYGEELCLSLEVLSLNYKILFTNEIRVLHRKNTEERKKDRRDVFRFRKQLVNTTSFYLVYYPFPLVVIKILKLYVHNFWKYGIKEYKMFFSFINAIWCSARIYPSVIKWRKPISRITLINFNKLKSPLF